MNIDSDLDIAYKHADIWAVFDVGIDRVDNMIDGIKLLMQGDYLFVGINGDAVDFMPLLSTMRSVTNTPIFIVTGSFSTEKEVAALNNGADLYARWHDTPEDNIASVRAHIARKTERHKTPHKVLVYRDLLVSPFQRNVFVGNEKIDLTRQEFDLLHYMMEHQRQVLTFEQIYRTVWNYEYEESANDVVRSAIKRLRKKISGEDSDNSYIKNVRDVGYKLSANFD